MSEVCPPFSFPRRRRESDCEKADDPHHPRGVQQGGLPGYRVDQPLDQRDDGESSERAGRGNDAEGGGPFFGGYHPAHGAEKHDVGCGAECETDQGSEGEEGQPGDGGHGEQDETGRVQEGAGGHYPARPHVVGEHAGEGQPEQEVLQGHGEAETLPARRQRLRHRLQEQSERLAGPHGDGDDDRADQDDESGFFHDRGTRKSSGSEWSVSGNRRRLQQNRADVDRTRIRQGTSSIRGGGGDMWGGPDFKGQHPGGFTISGMPPGSCLPELSKVRRNTSPR